MTEPSARLLNVPKIDVSAVLLITVKTVPISEGAGANIQKVNDGAAVNHHIVAQTISPRNE